MTAFCNRKAAVAIATCKHADGRAQGIGEWNERFEACRTDFRLDLFFGELKLAIGGCRGLAIRTGMN